MTSDYAHPPALLPSERDLRRARRSMWRSLSFDAELESAFRESQDRRYRVPRTLFFGIAALSFLFAPLVNSRLFAADASVLTQLWLIQWAWAVPALCLGAVAPWLRLRRTPLYAIHVGACATLWASCYAQLFLSQLGLLDYPLHVVNFTVMAVAMFGGFRPRLIMLGGSIAIALGLATTLYFERPGGYPDRLFVYETIYFWLIGIGGVVTIDLLNRESWLNRRRVHLLARTDALSGLLNRGAFNELYDRVIAMASREQRHVAVALIDLDHFKTFNDRYGHLKGDEVLAETGRALRSVEGGRPLDLRARYGGEEFVAVWYDVQPDDLGVMGQRFLDAIRGLRVYGHPNGERLPLTASVGVIAAVPERGGGEALLRAADEQLYAAKAAGRNRAHTAVLVSDAAPPQAAAVS